MNTNFHKSKATHYEAVLDELEENCDNNLGQSDPEEKKQIGDMKPNKWLQYVSNPNDEQSNLNKFQQEATTSPKLLPTSSSFQNSYMRPSFSSRSSIYHQAKPAPLPKLIDLHKKSDLSLRLSHLVEPPQKRIKTEEFEDEFALSQDDLDHIDSFN